MASPTDDVMASEGPSTDASNNPVIDPTKNVLQLVEAAMERQDDLRGAASQLDKERDAHLREIIQLRADERTRDIEYIRALEAERAEHTKEMRIAEADRINAIRAVDNQAVQQAAQVSATQATTLANQVVQSAEAMRVQVAATANASAIALSNALEPITKAIEELRRSQYEAQGQKTQVVETRQQGASNGQWAAVAVAFVVMLVAIASVTVAISNGGNASSVPATTTPTVTTTTSR